MLHFTRILWALMVILPAQVTAAQYVTAPEIDENYQVPDHGARANILLERFRLLRDRYQKLSRGETPDTVDELLSNLFLPQSAREFQQHYRAELAVADQPKQANRWLQLAHHYSGQGRHEDAASAAYRAHALSRDKRLQAQALQLMAENYVALGHVADALNLLHLSLRRHADDNVERRIETLKARFFLTIRDIAVNVEQTTPSACVVFSKPLLPGQHPEDYVSLAGVSDVDINLQGNRICLNGLAYGETYEVRIRKGLKGANNTLLDQDDSRRFTVNDRESRTTFDSNSYVISRTTDNSVPVTTVNVTELNLRLYLIHDRNLIHGPQNSLFDSLNSYNETQIKEKDGALVWEGDLPIDGARNSEITTLIPVEEMIRDRKHGIYVLVAREPKAADEPEWRYQSRAAATQWLLVSDMGLMTIKSAQGLQVMVRSLETADPLKNIVLTLIARNNRILGTARSDKNGIAEFAPGLTRGKGGDAPALITAQGKKDDYNFLKLEKSYLDLSERGVTGRPAPGKQDAFLYTDRGVYRPGAAVKLSALLRDPESRAIGNLPLHFKISKPDGSLLMANTVTGDPLGGYFMDIPLSPSALPGPYTVRSYLDQSADSLGSVSFQVEDFVPQRIRAQLETDAQWLETDKPAAFTLQADFLYGPPATDLKTETRISLRRNPQPYADFKEFTFGLVEDGFQGKSLPPVHVRTDDRGAAVIPVELPDLPDTSRPLLAYIQSAVFDVSGRPVEAQAALPVRSRFVEVGVRRDFTGNLEAGDEAGFDVIALDREGNPVAGRRISYELVKEDYYYSWYRSGGDWDNRRHITDSMVETGTVETDDQGRARISPIARDGRFRMTVQDLAGSSAASLRYHVGWWSSGTLPNVPDELEMTLEQADVRDGETLKAFVRAPFAGKATVMVMNSQLRFVRNIVLPEQGREISVKVDRDWGPGAYLMVAAFRPDAGKITKLPVRAMNLTWFSIDQDRRRVDVNLEVPEQVTPRQTVTLPVTVSGGHVAGQKIRLTIAAVDEGILGLTDFKSPDPADHYLSQRRLGMELADIYGRLIKPVEGLRGQLRSGGDLQKMTMADARFAEAAVAEENVTGVQTRTVKTVALYRRDIMLDQNGKGSVTLDLPDFNGRLRLMAVAYGEDVVGAGDQELIVRDPVVADLLLPRFLAPGDRADSTLTLHNLSGKARDFAVELDSSPRLAADITGPLTVSLSDGQRFEKEIAVTAGAPGDGRLSLHVTSAGLSDIARRWDIAVRPGQPYITRRAVSYLESGDQASLSRADMADFLPGSIKTTVTVTNKPDFNVPGLLDSLYDYPYFCGEPVTSRALALLYYADVADTWDQTYDPLELRRDIEAAITNLLALQKHDGSFAMWRATGETHPWLTAYVFEFLTRAREQDIPVPAAAYDHSRAWLNDFVKQRDHDAPHTMAYAHYVLARIGDVTPGIVRYFADRQGDKIDTRLGLGHLASALNLVGEKDLAGTFFQKALTAKRPRGEKARPFRDFGSDLRDGAALAALLAEADPGGSHQMRVAEELDREFDRREYFSTQEKAWLLLATHAISRTSAEGFQVAVNDKELPVTRGALRYSLKSGAIEQGFNVENIGGTPVRVIRSIRGVPEETLKPASRGFDISRAFFTLNGEAADLDNIRQNDMLVVVIQGRAENRINHEALIVDLLPAGFEIENAAIGGFEAEGVLDFVPRKTAFVYEAGRDDRYVAALNLQSHNSAFATSYIVRAVTPGSYHLPAVFIEDMYKPQYHARGAAGAVTIRE